MQNNLKIKNRIFVLIPFQIIDLIRVWINIIFNDKSKPKAGDKIDSLNGVFVYYNGDFNTIIGRNMTSDGYNIGLNYQCVEFVKRYYYEHFNHKMPDTYGHAKDFFNGTLGDGQLNKIRDLIQYSNPSLTLPKVGDLLVYKGTVFNEYGHVAIVSNVSEDKIEIIQQNSAQSRESFELENINGTWKVKDSQVLGWLRKI